MAGFAPGDPQLVSMIVNHLKTQGLFDQFRRDCLADVDTKPAYLNLKQRVDNFVSNHLSNHTWSPHLNKNQLRNNIRQLVLQSGMLEQGVDRIVAQVVDPKVNHIFRPQVERVVREFLSPGSCSEEPAPPVPPPLETTADCNIPEQPSSLTPAASTNPLSILDTITSLNQEASVRASSAPEKIRRGPMTEESMQLMEEGEQDESVIEEGDSQSEDKQHRDTQESKSSGGVQMMVVKMEETQGDMEMEGEEWKDDVKMEHEESGSQQQSEEDREKHAKHISGKPSEEKQEDDFLTSSSQAKQKARERIKEEYSLEDSDLEGLSDITVSSVHTSDLSSFGEESEDEEMLSDSSEEGELPPDQDDKKHAVGETGDEDKECKPRRKAYIHKPFLYSRYYSDSDDEVTVEEHRRSVAKDKEERLLKRQQNRERMEEKRKQRAPLQEEQDNKNQKGEDAGSKEGPRAKEARKERKVLEKKMALSRKRKLDSRKEGDAAGMNKGETEDPLKRSESKLPSSKNTQTKLFRNLSESASFDDRHRRISGSFSEDSSDAKKPFDKSRTHSFILELEQGSHEALKQRSVGKFDRLSRKEFHPKERKGSLSDERVKLKLKLEKRSEHQSDDLLHRESQAGKVSSEEKGEKKLKVRSEKKMAGSTDEGNTKEFKKMKTPVVDSIKTERDRNKEKDKIKEKGKCERSSVKGDFKPLLQPDSTGSSEDRSDMEPGFESGKRKDKHSKEAPKRFKSHSEGRPTDKPKSKIEKDSEKEKVKDQERSSKSNSEIDKDQKKPKVLEKGKTSDRSKSKSKDEAKALLIPKTEKKAQSPEVRSAGGASLSKAEAAKEKKKEPKMADESSHDKSDLKCASKRLEKKDKSPENIADTQEEKKPQREDKLEKAVNCLKSPVPLPSQDTDEPPKKKALVQDTSTDSYPASATITPSFSDETCNALSSIAPKLLEGETDARVGELPTEADALLSLVDVCALAEPRRPAGCLKEDQTSEMDLQDADMKMKEAALTLLSMDPDSTVSSSLIAQTLREEAAVEAAGDEEQLLHEEVQTAAELPQPTPQHAVKEKTHSAGHYESSNEIQSTSEVGSLKVLALQEDSTSGQTSLNNEGEVVSETQVEEKATMSADKKEAVQTKAMLGGSSAAQQEQTKLSAVVMRMNLTTEVVVPEESPANIDVNDGNVSRTDSMEEEKGLELSQKGQGRRKRKLSSQKVSAVEEPGHEKESKELLSAEIFQEAEFEKGTEIKTPRRGRSSKTTEEAECPKEPERTEEGLSCRGRRSGVKTKETSVDNPNKEAKVEEGAENSSLNPAEKDMRTEEESIQKKSGGYESEIRMTAIEDGESAGSSNSKDKTDMGRQAVKCKRSEQPEEPEQLFVVQEEVKNNNKELDKDTGPASVDEKEKSTNTEDEQQQPIQQELQQPEKELQQPGEELQQQQKPEEELEQQQKPGEELEQLGEELQQQQKPGKELQQKLGDELQQKPGEQLQQKPGEELEQPKYGEELQQQQKPGEELEQQQKPGEELEQLGEELQQQQKPGKELQQKLGEQLQQKPGEELEQQQKLGEELQQPKHGEELQQQQKLGEEQQQKLGEELQQQQKPEEELQQQQKPEEELQQQPGEELQQQQKPGEELQQQQKPGEELLQQQQKPGEELQQQQKPGEELQQQQKPGEELLQQQQKPGEELQQQQKPGEELLQQQQKPGEELQQPGEELQQLGEELQQQQKPGEELQQPGEELQQQQLGKELQQQQKPREELQQQQKPREELQQQQKPGEELQQPGEELQLQQQPGEEAHQQKQQPELQKEEQETALKKPVRRGRPSKAAASGDQDKKGDVKQSEQNDEDEDEEGTTTRASTRLASRLEAERNKPSTRARRLTGREETRVAATRGTRGQAVAKGIRKHEVSPPAGRTRGGQKLEESPAKRAKR